jgi:acylphosphatase
LYGSYVLIIIYKDFKSIQISTMKRIHIYVSGLVQGVYFRHNAFIQAEGLGLKGWARNLTDGRVEIICEGSNESVDKMAAWCRVGPRGACVNGLDIQQEEFKNEFKNFQILY